MRSKQKGKYILDIRLEIQQKSSPVPLFNLIVFQRRDREHFIFRFTEIVGIVGEFNSLKKKTTPKFVSGFLHTCISF